MAFAPSTLGTKEYWDEVYVKELDNYQSNAEDVGEIWFGERTEEKLVGWLEDNASQKSSIVDLGTGNGHLLARLAEEGFTNLTGIDYALSSIELAKAINIDNPDITFLHMDILNSESSLQYDICLDKGTYDAISLSESADADRQTYKSKVHKMVDPKTGKFVLASVNWTADEISSFFSDLFSLETVLPSKQFTFGGVVGADVTIVVLKPIETL